MENRKPIIYFSKSRAGNFDDILKVKNYLAKYDCEIIEFTDGIYTPEKLDSADLLLILPPELDKYEFVGKGQFEEFIKACNDVDKWSIPVIITAIEDGIPYGVQCDEGDIIDKNWTTDYGRFLSIDKDEELPIDDALDLRYKSYGKTKSKSKVGIYPNLEEEKYIDPITAEFVDYLEKRIEHQTTYEEVFNSLNLL